MWSLWSWLGWRGNFYWLVQVRIDGGSWDCLGKLSSRDCSFFVCVCVCVFDPLYFIRSFVTVYSRLFFFKNVSNLRVPRAIYLQPSSPCSTCSAYVIRPYIWTPVTHDGSAGRAELIQTYKNLQRTYYLNQNPTPSNHLFPSPNYLPFRAHT